jgi:hypothetical protein
MAPSEGKKQCQYCEQYFKPRGHGTHEAACKKQESDRHVAAKLKAQRRKTSAKPQGVLSTFILGDAAYARITDPKRRGITTAVLLV